MITVEVIPMMVTKPTERMAGCTAKNSEPTPTSSTKAENTMADLWGSSRSPVPRWRASSPSMMKML